MKKIRGMAAAVCIALLLAMAVPVHAAQPEAQALRALRRTKSPAMGTCYVYPYATTYDTTVRSGQTALLCFRRDEASPGADDVFHIVIFRGDTEAVMRGGGDSVEERSYAMRAFGAEGSLAIQWKADSRYPQGDYLLIGYVSDAGGRMYAQDYFAVELHVRNAPCRASELGVELVQGGEFHSPYGMELSVGQSICLAPLLLPYDSTEPHEWTAEVDIPQVAAVRTEGGYVYLDARAVGDVTLTVRHGTLEKTIGFHVGGLKSFRVVQEHTTLCVGMTETPQFLTEPELPILCTWTSRDESILRVENGKITAVSPGTATLTAYCDGKESQVTYHVVYHQLPAGTPVHPHTATQPAYAAARCLRCGCETAVNRYDPPVFTDTDPGAWYCPYVDDVYARGILTGTNVNTFAPNVPLTRAMVATVLHRMAGSPQCDTEAGFTDVPDGQWYSEAVRWAAAEKVITGYPDGSFRPNSSITREQLAVLLWRSMGSPDADAALSEFCDAAAVQPYALQAMRWAVENGRINGVAKGTGTYLAPQSPTTRAQFSAIISRQLQKQTE